MLRAIYILYTSKIIFGGGCTVLTDQCSLMTAVVKNIKTWYRTFSHLREEILVSVLTLEIFPVRHRGDSQDEGTQYRNDDVVHVSRGDIIQNTQYIWCDMKFISCRRKTIVLYNKYNGQTQHTVSQALSVSHVNHQTKVLERREETHTTNVKTRELSQHHIEF